MRKENKLSDELISTIADLDLKGAMDIVHKKISDGEDPLSILRLCNKGLIHVGRHYEDGVYFISGLIMAGEIMRQIGQYVMPLVKSEESSLESGRILIGTAQFDIHFIGKNIFKMLARSHGFSVHDLGINVSPNKFLSAVYEFKPDIIGISCLISTAYESMRDTIVYLRQNIPADISPKAYVIGGHTDEKLCEFANADYWVNDAMNGVRICQEIILNSFQKT